jgi:uncharacterized protein (TIGR03435 family)
LKNQLLCVAVVFAVYAPTLKSQDPRPKFEVASIKECKSIDRPPPSTNSPGRLSLSCWQLKRLIQQAYEVYADGKVDPLNPFLPTTPLEGEPAWVEATSYSIDAKAETPQSAAMMMGPMMQTLLEGRFGLKTHRETREIPVYLMTVAKGGAKLKPSTEDSCRHIDPTDFAQPPLPPGGKACVFTMGARKGPIMVMDIYGITLDVFARIMHPGGRQVIDRTGLTGTFDIHMEHESVAPSPDGGASDPGMPEIAAMREQLGLRLDPGKGPIEFLVIDRIQRPSGN